MADVKVELISEGIRELLKSAELMNECEKKASEVASRVQHGTVRVETNVGSTRASAKIVNADNETYYRQMNTNELIHLVKGGSR